jgi:hypothetical protein
MYCASLRNVKGGTVQVLSFVLVKVIITGPFWPVFPWCMWAAVPAIPEVVTVPVTAAHQRPLEAAWHLDWLIKMSAVPEALVPTGGTSWFPVS